MSTGTKVERILRIVFAGLLLASTASAQPPRPGGGGPQAPRVVSPQVLPDHRIVFRLLAPQAQSVRIVGTDIPSLAGGRGTPPPASASAMKKSDSGVWEATVDPVPPGSYRYNFNVDGVSVIDPRNPSTSESNTNTWSLVHVPGAEFMDTLQVPHGGVTSVTYYSTALGRFRRMHVYTPPGYELGTNRLPVLYLLHGAGDSDASWSSVGRAGFILDNLIAAKKAKPMLVVMTAGHTSALPASAAAGASPRDEFADDFETDVMPYIERTYRVLTDRPNRAMAGLSMGGSQTLNIAFRHLDKFAYLGIFSSGATLGGGQIADWESTHKTGLDDASLKKGLRLLWLSTGVNDFVLPNTRTTVDMLKKHGFTLVFKESAGAHTWNNWRDYLNEFAQQLFQQTTSTATSENRIVTEADCTAAPLVATIAPKEIGEAVRSVSLQAAWVPATDAVPAHCRVDGVFAPVDTAPTARVINFRVILPASWNHKGAQIGGGGINGVIPNVAGGEFGAGGPSLLSRGFATYGSDSGHQLPAFGRRGGPPSAPPDQDWALNEEAIRNFGYAQMKKTHDAAMVLIQRMYGERPRFNYYIGTSQGGREALTVANRYPADYDGVAANVPIVNFSSLMLAPELIRIHEKPSANWVTLAKINAIRGEFVRQCDGLDGVVDGIMNNYMACRGIFDLSRGVANRHPWAAKRCPNNVDPDPSDTSANACLTDGQISTLEFVYSHYKFASPLANDVREFGMWTPGTDPSGSGLILPARFRGQEGAAADAPMHSHLGVLGVTGFLMQDVKANPLDYVEGGALNERRRFLSEILDSTNPDFSAFARRGGKMLVAIGTNDTLASPGSQLDFYQSVVDRMGRAQVDRFARFFVMPQTGHGLSGTNYATSGDGQTLPVAPVPNTYDRLGLLFDWVERGVAPGMSVTVTAGEKSLPLCSYPSYPRYVTGPAASASSYRCNQP